MTLSIRRQLRILQLYPGVRDGLTIDRPRTMTVAESEAASIDCLGAAGNTIQRIPASKQP